MVLVVAQVVEVLEESVVEVKVKAIQVLEELV